MRVCKVDGCERKYHANGYCNLHNFRFKKGLDINAPICSRKLRDLESLPDVLCKHFKCDKVFKKLHNRHYFCSEKCKYDYNNRWMVV